MGYEKEEMGGEKYKDNRNWKNYNRKLVRRGEAYISLDFIETWKKELDEMNKGKEGAPYVFHLKFLIIQFLSIQIE